MLRKYILILMLVGLSLSLLGGMSDLQAAQDTRFPTNLKAKYAPGEILVKFKGVKSLPSFGPAAEATFQATLPAKAQAALQGINGSVKRVFPLISVSQVQIPAQASVGAAVEALYRSGAVEYAEPNYQVKAVAVPNDTQFSNLWGLHNTGQAGGTVDADIDAPEAWNINKDANTVIVGVIDTGVDYNHEDLAANMWQNPSEIAGNGVDDDGNGYIDDVYGIDRYNYDSNPMDDHGHGTHCSGTIGGVGNNGKGVCGVGWTAKIMALKFLSSGGSGYTADAITCITYALAEKTANSYPRMVLSNSWGGGSYSQSLYDAIKAAMTAGVIFVAAAGNNGEDSDAIPSYPADYDLPNVISVGASDRYDQYPTWSNYGSATVDLFAPGVEILSTTPSNAYGSMSGTSMACPHVSGACAVIWHKYSGLPWRKIKGRILNGAEDGQGTPAPYFAQRCITEGRLNLKNSLSGPLGDDAAIFSVKPNRAQATDKITIEGINFGTTGTLSFLGVSFAPADIVSWSDQKIVAKVPAIVPRGFGRLLVTTTAGISRGAAFGVSSGEALAGQTILGHGWAASAKVGTSVWILGGGSHWGMTGLVEKYDLATQTSVIDSSWMMPKPATNTGGAAVGTKIYVVGGYDWNTAEVFDSLQIFDTATGTWTTGANFPKKIQQPTVVAYNGKVYVLGGTDDAGTKLNTAYVYDPGTNSWATKASMPTAVSYGAGALLDNKILVMGGFTTSSFGSELNIVQQYNPATNSWTTLASLNKTRGGAGGAALSGKAFCLHGAGNGLTSQSDSEWYQSGSPWANDIFGSQGLYTPAGASYSGRIYSLSGYNYSTSYSKNVWRFLAP